MESIRKNTGVVHDLRMLEHQSLWYQTHPERPERLTSIIDRCNELQLLDRCCKIPSRFATTNELFKHHTKEHVEKLKKICTIQSDPQKLEEISSVYEAVYIHPTTYDLALLSCGSTIDLVKRVVDGSIQNGMAIVRPPGHHAMKGEYCGFCFFNNVVVAAKEVLDTYPNIKKILVVDWDVHHGQGTQQAFYDDPRVLYFSTHRYEYGKYWPNLEESNFNWIGSGEGIGFNCNVPLNVKGLGDAEFLSVWHKILLPMAYEFSPDLVIVSAGFDSALGCPTGMMRLSPRFYPHLLWPLMALANGKVAVVLEGGYCLKSLAEGAALTLRALLGDPCPQLDPISNPNPIMVEAVLNVTCMFKKSWNFSPAKFADEAEFNRISLDKKFIQNYRYDYKQTRPKRYPTRNFVPLPSEEVRAMINDELDRQIAATSLEVAKHKIGVFCHEDILHPDLQNRCYIIHEIQASVQELTSQYSSSEIGEVEKSAGGTFINLVDNVLNSICHSGVLVKPIHWEMEKIGQDLGKRFEILDLAEHLTKTNKVQRLLQISIGKKQSLSYDPKLLKINFYNADTLNSDTDLAKHENYNVNIEWHKPQLGETGYINGILQVVLPIAYEFAPELVLISFSDYKLLPEFYARMMHLLSSFANGRIIAVFEPLNQSPNYISSINWCVKSLLGDSIPPACFCPTSNENALEDIRKAIEVQGKYWGNLTPFLKILPAVNSISPGYYKIPPEGIINQEDATKMLEKWELENRK